MRSQFPSLYLTIIFSMILASWSSVLLCGAVTAVVSAATFNANALTKFNVFVKTPADTDGIIHTGGRLIERHLAYLQEAGYQGLLSVVAFPTNDTVYNGVEGAFPSSDYEMVLASSHGLSAKYVASSLTLESALEISGIMDSLPRPLYVHCHVGYTANLFTQLHLYLTGQLHQASDILTHSLALGYDYQNNSDVTALINAVVQQKANTTPVTPFATHAEVLEQSLIQGEMSYKYAYWPHLLAHSSFWYNAGQFLETQVSVLTVTAGYTTIISFRTDGEATARLSTEPTTGPVANFEFSDANGLYSVEKERNLVQQSSSNVRHVHLPLDAESADTWTRATYEAYLPTLLRVQEDTQTQVTLTGKGAILVHCASGYRSAAFVLTFLAEQHNRNHQETESLCSDWVFQQARQVGFVFDNTTPTSHDTAVVNFVYDILGC